VPAEAAYRLAVAGRGWAYDRDLFASQAAPIPTLAIGNLTVGGTGKTPLTAWFAGELLDRGCSPSVILRGYGDDEVEVHRLLNPEANVHVSANRVAGVQWVSREGSDVAVLDDAFQHRALRAEANVVLLAVEEWMQRPRLLPRGPWREPLSALQRATLVVATRKVGSPAESERMREHLSRLRPELPQAQAYIGIAGLARYHASEGRLETPLATRGFSCPLAVAGVAKPSTVSRQLEQAGVSVGRFAAFSDHHRYKEPELERIRLAAAGGPLVATLKDAVKLGPALAADLEIYVPLQEIIWESGEDEIECLITNLHARALEARSESR
jgi:tetraacyldisaccharide 4'-kinase